MKKLIKRLTRHAISRRVPMNLVDDLVQDTLIKVMNFERKHNNLPPFSLVITMFRNVTQDAISLQKRRIQMCGEELATEADVAYEYDYTEPIYTNQLLAIAKDRLSGVQYKHLLEYISDSNDTAIRGRNLKKRNLQRTQAHHIKRRLKDVVA